VTPAAPAAISGRVWNDTNADGIRNAGETGVFGVTVNLIDEYGRVTASGVTTSDGTYTLSNLIVEVPYRLQFVAPNGKSFSAPDRGADDSVDSDVNPGNSRTAPFTFASGEVRINFDAGLVALTQIFGGAFRDANENGVRDDFDVEFPGATLFVDLDQDGVVDDIEPSALQTGTSFSLKVPPGTWPLSVVPPAGWTTSTPLPLRTFSIAAGQQLSDVRVGLKPVTPPPTQFLARDGGEFLVNQTTAGSQGQPSIGADVSGAFVAVWYTPPATDADPVLLVGRRFAPGGAPLGNEFVIDAPALAPPPLGAPQVAVADNGDFVVAWGAADVNNRLVYARRYSQSGAPVGAPILVSGGYSYDARVAIDPTGGFAVVWTGFDGDGGGVFARRYDVDGQPRGAVFPVNDATAGQQSAAGVGFDGQGRMTVAYSGSPFSGKVMGRRFAANGDPLGPGFAVNETAVTPSPAAGTVAVDALGNTAYIWVRSGEVYTRVFDPSGAPRGGEVHLNSLGFAAQSPGLGGYPQIVAARDGSGFLAAWITSALDGSGNGIFGSMLRTDGLPSGRQFQMNTTTAGTQQWPALAAGAGKTFIAAWSSANQDGSLEGVYAQRLSAFSARSSISGVSWKDINGDGIRQDTEPPLAGTKAFLLDASGVAVDMTTTGADGTYTLTTLRPNDIYHMQLVVPSQLLGATPDQGNDDSRDSDAALFTGLTAPFVAPAASGVLTGIDASGMDPATILGTIFYDVNNNGTREPSEERLPGWTAFIDEDGDGQPDPNEPQFTSVASPTAVASYAFAGLRPGTYRVTVVTTAHWRVTGPAPQTLQATVLPGETATLPDLAAVPTVPPTDRAVPAGAELRVNTTTAGGQLAPAAAADATGNYVLVWYDATGVFAQRYAADGSAAGAELTIAPAGATAPAVAMADDGRFVVTWTSAGDVFARRYSAAGVPAGNASRVNTTTTDVQQNADVAYDDTGAFVVVWQSKFQDGSGDGVYAQRYNADGTPRGIEFLASVTTSLNQTLPKVAADAAGNFVVAYLSDHSSGKRVYARRFSADGTGGPELLVNTGTIGTNYDAVDVAMNAAGESVIVYRGNDAAGFGIEARRFDKQGAPIGDAFVVNTTTGFSQEFPSVRMSDDGRFVIAWQSTGEEGSSTNAGIRAQWFDGSGVRLGGEIVVNTTTALNQTDPDVALVPSGFVVTWVSDGQDGSSTGIYARRYAAFVTPVLTSVTVGDGSAQRSMVKSLSLSFDRPVALAASAAKLELLNTGGSGANDGSAATDATAALLAPITTDNGNTWVFPLSPGSAFVQNGSLADGIYRLRVDPTKVTTNGVAMSAAPAPFLFHRLFGDVTGDAAVNPLDYVRFRSAFGKSTGDATYDAAFDFNNDGTVNPLDYNQFRQRFGKALAYAPS
jgi:hypothetical protein